MSTQRNVNEEDHSRIETLLREQAPAARVPAPASIRARVSEHLFESATPLHRPGRWRLVVSSIGSLAAAAALAWALLPAHKPAPTRELAIELPLDPRPVIVPAGRFVAGSIDRPLMGEAAQLVNDTRRATRFVVDCLPFTSGGG